MTRRLRAAGLLLACCLPAAAAAAGFGACADAADFPELAGSQCLRVQTPLRHDIGESSGTIELFVRRFPAENPGNRRGEIWFVAGGPGESGAAFYPLLATLRRAFPQHDLVMPDHRGTGYSGKLCPVQEAPDSADGIALTPEEWGPCLGALHGDPRRAHAFTITQAAYDLAGLIRDRRGEGELYLYAVSYGTQLALRMMQATPIALDGPIDGLILDGLIPPETAAHWDLGHRTGIVDAVGRASLTPAQVRDYRRLLEAAPGTAWLADVPGGDLRVLMGALLNFPRLRARIPDIVGQLLDGNTDALNRTVADLEAALAAATGHYPQSPASLPLTMLISNSENNARRDLTRDIVADEARDALFTSPLPGLLIDPPVPLYSRDPHFGRLPASLPPTLVLHGTLDPNTPYAGARAHFDLLAGAGELQFSTVEGGAHSLAYIAPDCFVAAASAFIGGTAIPASCTPTP